VCSELEKAKYCGLLAYYEYSELIYIPVFAAVINHNTGFRLNDNYSFIRYFLQNSVHCNDSVFLLYRAILRIYYENYTKHRNVG